MSTATRKIIEIDNDKCDGCGACVTACAEAAMEVRDGKAVVVRDIFCDGLGACLAVCPQDALHVVERQCAPFDEAAALEHVRATRGEEGVRQMLAQNAAHAAHDHTPAAKPLGCGCPGSNMMSFAAKGAAKPIRRAAEPCPCSGGDEPETAPSELSHWPVQIRLVPPDAPFLKGADLLIAADCVPVAFADFHGKLLAGRKVLIGCPKFDDAEMYVERLAALFATARPASVTVARMEVPCCKGLSTIVDAALRASGAAIPRKDVVITRQGDMVEDKPAAALAPM